MESNCRREILEDPAINEDSTTIITENSNSKKIFKENEEPLIKLENTKLIKMEETQKLNNCNNKMIEEKIYPQINIIPSNLISILHKDHFDFLINGYLYNYSQNGEIEIHQLEENDFISNYQEDKCEKMDEFSHIQNKSELTNLLNSMITKSLKNVLVKEKKFEEEETFHKHGPHCGHQFIYHAGHIDYIVNGVLHYQHNNNHCDNHGIIKFLKIC